MYRSLILFANLLFCFISHAQDIEWDDKHILRLTDFRSPATQIGSGNIYSLNSGVTFDFAFHMTNAEFIFTKNFNSKVNCFFRPDASYIVSPDSATAFDMLDFARFEFDITELYARKFRKKIFEKKRCFFRC